MVWYVLARAFPGPFTDSATFDQALAGYRQGRPNYVAHFPASITSAASQERYYFQPGVLQSGTRLELAVRLPPEQLETVAEELAKRALRDPDCLVPERFPVADDCVLPRVYVLGYEYSFDCWGVAIDRRNSVIIYWMNDD